VFDPITRVSGINIAGVQLDSCFAPVIENLNVQGYFDYGLRHHGIATTGNSEQGGFMVQSQFVSQRAGCVIDHSNTVAPIPFHPGFQIVNCHFNGFDYGLQVVKHGQVTVAGSLLYVSNATRTSIAQPVALDLKETGDVSVTGCVFGSIGMYVSNANASVGIAIGAACSRGVNITGCQFAIGGIGILNNCTVPVHVHGVVLDGQKNGLWATFVALVDNTGTVIMSGGPASTAAGETRVVSQKTAATVAPRLKLFSQRTDYAGNATSDGGAYDFLSLNSGGAEVAQGLLAARWQSNTAAAEYGAIDVWFMDNGTLNKMSFDAQNKAFNLPTGYGVSENGTKKIIFGSGNPNGAVTASPGALYFNAAGGAATTLYVKESGVGTNTGWVGK
jgi:hypothetical protein